MFNRTTLGGFTPVLPLDYVFPPTSSPTTVRSKLVPPRTTISLQGVSRRGTFRIIDGCIALYQLLADGRRQILDILGPGRLLGTGITDRFQCGAETLAFTHLEEIEPERSKEAADGQLELLLSRSLAHATLLGRKTAPEKIATTLLDLAQQFGRRSRSPAKQLLTFTLHLTRADLADWTGLTLETVSRHLNGFKRARLIDFKTPELITIRDRSALTAIAAGEAIPDNH